MAKVDASEIGLLFVTIGRPDCALRLIETVHHHHPEFQVYVVEQAHEGGILAERCEELGYHHELAPFDAGVSYCRNIGIQRIKEEFFLLADDDFFFKERIRYEMLLPLFDDRPALLMVGGDLDEEVDANARRPAILLHRGRHILHDKIGQGVLLCSTVFLGTSSFQYGGELFHRCDMVAQWAFCRTSLFRTRQLAWDIRFKNNGEHLDFFLNIQVNHADLEILYWPGLRCSHAPDRDESYETLRMRDDWQQPFAEKWHLKYQGNLGGAIRLFDEKLGKPHFPNDGELQGGNSAAKLKDLVSRQRQVIARKDERIAQLKALLSRR